MHLPPGESIVSMVNYRDVLIAITNQGTIYSIQQDSPYVGDLTIKLLHKSDVCKLNS